MARQPARAREHDAIGTVAEWHKVAIHTVTCPSGFKCRIVIPDLPELLRADAIPAGLRSIALRALQQQLTGEGFLPPAASTSTTKAQEDEPAETEVDRDAETEKLVEDMRLLRRTLVTLTVVEPEITDSDLDGMPALDREMIAEFAMRERDIDAIGVSIGVAPMTRFRVFREEHECDADCAACERSRLRLSGDSVYA